MQRRRIKRKAKKLLAGLWGCAVALLLIRAAFSLFFVLLERTVVSVTGTSTLEQLLTPYALYGAGAIPPALLAFALGLFLCCASMSFLVNVPLRQGIVSWYYRRASEETPRVSSAFERYTTARKWGKTIALYLLLAVKKALWRLLFLMPAIVFFFLYELLSALKAPFWQALTMLVLAVCLGVVGTLVSLVVCYRYFLVVYIYADDPAVRIRTAFRSSVRVTKGRKGALFALDLSLLPCYLLSLLILPCVGTVPYIGMTKALYARRYVEDYKRQASEKQETEPIFEKQGETND